jgi:hypothetical protein
MSDFELTLCELQRIKLDLIPVSDLKRLTGRRHFILLLLFLFRLLLLLLRRLLLDFGLLRRRERPGVDLVVKSGFWFRGSERPGVDLVVKGGFWFWVR